MVPTIENKTPLGVNMTTNKSITVIIADDSSTVRMITKQHLMSQKFDVIAEAIDGNDFIEKYNSAPVKPDMVFVDIDMPGKTGIEAVKIIRPTNPNLKIVMVTGHSDQEKVKEAVQAGINAYIVKPFDRATLLERLAKLLGRQDYL